MQKDLISIIVPIYNASKFIGRCLRSLINQTYSNIEILCVDDCSTDNSYELVEEFVKKDNRVKLFKNIKNSGPATTRNVGLKNAQGEFIMFCDNDDEYKQNMCEVMLSTIKSEDVDLVICNADIHNSAFDLPLAGYVNSIPIGVFPMNQDNFPKVNVLVWNKIYRKALIDKYDLSFPDGLSGEDDEFIALYYLISDKFCGIKDELYNHYFHSESYTFTRAKFNSGKRLYEKLKIIEHLYFCYKKMGMTEQNFWLLKLAFIRELDYIRFYSKDKKLVKDIEKKYNRFILNNEELPWDEFNYSALYQCSQGDPSFKKINRLFQCIWF